MYELNKHNIDVLGIIIPKLRWIEYLYHKLMKISMFWIDVGLPGNDYTVAMLSKLLLDKNRFDIEKLTKELTVTYGRKYRPKFKNTFATWDIRNPVTSVCVIFWQLPSQVMTKLFEYAIAHKLVPVWLRNLLISTIKTITVNTLS